MNVGKVTKCQQEHLWLAAEIQISCSLRLTVFKTILKLKQKTKKLQEFFLNY